MSRLPALILLLHTYIGWRLFVGMPAGSIGIIAACAVGLWLVASASLLLLAVSSRRHRRPLTDGQALASWLAAGAFSSLLLLTLLRDLLLLIGALLGAIGIDGAFLQTLAQTTGVGVPLVAALVTGIGFLNARRPARVRSIDIPIARLPRALHNFTIAQISDLHVGATIKRNYVQAIVDAVNALGADVIAVTGDLVDGSVQHLAHETAPLAGLSAKHGSYFVTGNHEYYSGANAWIAELRRLGLRVLQNEHVVLQHQGGLVVLAGVTDFSAHHFDPAQRSDPAAAIVGAPKDAGVRVLLAHQPRSAAAAQNAGFDLQLSGHTHGGQFFPWNLFVRFQQPFTAGLHRLQSLWIYVSRGTGYWGPPKRIGAPSEITRLRLVPAAG